MTKHLEVDELEQGSRLEVCMAISIDLGTGKSRDTDPYPNCEFRCDILSGSSGCTPSHCPCDSVYLE